MSKKAASRRIFKSKNASHGEVKELLQVLFAAEIMDPSPCLWLISPWLSNVEIFDNSTGAFSNLDDNWAQRPIRLIEILGSIALKQKEIVIAVRDDAHNLKFERRLFQHFTDLGVAIPPTWIKRNELHIKGLLTSNFYLSGSMNFTFNGIEILEEGVVFETDKEVVSQAKIAFSENYGGAING